jgi:hypothetical protein
LQLRELTVLPQLRAFREGAREDTERVIDAAVAESRMESARPHPKLMEEDLSVRLRFVKKKEVLTFLWVQNIRRAVHDAHDPVFVAKVKELVERVCTVTTSKHKCSFIPGTLADFASISACGRGYCDRDKGMHCSP